MSKYLNVKQREEKLQQSKERRIHSFNKPNIPWEKYTVTEISLKTWAKAKDIHEIHNKNKTFGYHKLKKVVDDILGFEISVGSLKVMLNGLRRGWNPNEDLNWLTFQSEYDKNPTEYYSSLRVQLEKTRLLNIEKQALYDQKHDEELIRKGKLPSKAKKKLTKQEKYDQLIIDHKRREIEIGMRNAGYEGAITEDDYEEIPPHLLSYICSTTFK